MGCPEQTQELQLEESRVSGRTESAGKDNGRLVGDWVVEEEMLKGEESASRGL